jgi:hypothetical protein
VSGTTLGDLRIIRDEDGQPTPEYQKQLEDAATEWLEWAEAEPKPRAPYCGRKHWTRTPASPRDPDASTDTGGIKGKPRGRCRWNLPDEDEWAFHFGNLPREPFTAAQARCGVLVLGEGWALELVGETYNCTKQNVGQHVRLMVDKAQEIIVDLYGDPTNAPLRRPRHGIPPGPLGIPRSLWSAMWREYLKCKTIDRVMREKPEFAHEPGQAPASSGPSSCRE